VSPPSSSADQTSHTIDRRDTRVAACLRVPGLLWLAVLFVIPLAIVFGVSFASRGTYGGVEWTFTLENYRHLIDTPYLWIYLRSFALAAATTATCLFLGFPLAYYIARLPAGRQSLWLLLLMVPFWTNFLVRTYAMMFVLGSEGLLNTALLKVGLIQQPLDILYTDGAVLIGLVYGYLPFMVLPLYVVLARFDFSVVEAAQDLYASGPAVFWNVLVPLAKPGIVGGSLLVFIPSLGAYVTPDLLGGARTMMLGNLIQHEYLVIRDWPLGSAISFVLMAVVLAGAWLYRRLELARTGSHALTVDGRGEPMTGEVQ
jgi:spermidine/putrescine transport system permease protein